MTDQFKSHVRQCSSINILRPVFGAYHLSFGLFHYSYELYP